MPRTGGASSPRRAVHLAVARTTPLWNRYIPHAAPSGLAFASWSQRSRLGAVCFSGLAAQSAEPAERSISSPWPSAGKIASKFSRAAFSLPGRLTIRLPPRMPAIPRERQPRGVILQLSLRISSGRPGVVRSISSAVASGVMSRGEKPVPPVVRMSCTCSSSAAWRIAAWICSFSSGTSARCTTSHSFCARSVQSIGPLVSTRSPREHLSLTVMTAAVYRIKIPPFENLRGRRRIWRAGGRR